ncbi:hypothetical protein SLS62_008033 [Diatrype stigma]|uniref:Uncharacterized protein n=1 Tax=Diatrype stigma TaxID=117547 RepID=A0AAN9UPT7_9PEZI
MVRVLVYYFWLLASPSVVATWAVSPPPHDSGHHHRRRHRHDLLAAWSNGSSLAGFPERYVDTFRSGAIIDIAQEAQVSGDDGGDNGSRLPAILSVTATWNVPWIRPNPGADLQDINNQNEMGQWVGITGGACDDPATGGALLQAGTDSRLTETGETVAGAWVEWLPSGAIGLSAENMTGDHIRVSIRVDTSHEGFVEIENLSTAQTWADTITDPFYHPSPSSSTTTPSAGGVPLCLGNGTAWFLDEWVLGQPGAKPDSERAALPLFDNVTFSGVEARGRGNGSDGDGASRRFDLGGPEADFWNLTQARTGRAVAVAEMRAPDSFVVYSPGGKGWVPPPALLPLR